MKLTVFQRIFFVVFLFAMLFMTLLFGGLLFSGEWDAMKSVLVDPELHFAIGFTAWTTICATTVAFIIGLPTGYILARKEFIGKGVAETLVDIPIVLPPLVSGIALLTFFGPLFGDTLKNIGIDIVFSKWGVIIAQAFIAFPFSVRAFKQAFESVDTRYENIARTLGLTPFRVFQKVSLPMAREGIFNGITMTWARTLGEFGATAMLAGITRMKTETLSVAIFLNMSIGDFDFAIVISIIMLLLSLMVLYTVKLISRRGRVHE